MKEKAKESLKDKKQVGVESFKMNEHTYYRESSVIEAMEEFASSKGMPSEELYKLKMRYIAAHCNPDFKGNKLEYIFGKSLSESEEGEKEKGDWYCPECDAYLCNERVTFEEKCDTCGTDVEFKTVDTPSQADNETKEE